MSLLFLRSWRPPSFFSLLAFFALALDAPSFFFHFLPAVNALHLELSGQVGSASASAQRLRRRGNLVGDISVTDLSDVKYSVNMTIGGVPFNVQIDTGSSDLWVAASNISGSSSTGQTVSVQYAIGNIEGPVVTDSITFAGQTVDNQALILASPSSSNPAGQGLIGLGPNSGSHIAAAISGSTGTPVLENIFQQGVKPYLTIALGREADPSAPQPGDLTIGEVLANQTAVLQQPQLPMAVVSSSTGSENQHWQTLLDVDGIIGPDGQVINAQSVVAGTTKPNQLNVVFDTGFTLPQVPLAVASEIYGRAQGALFQNVPGIGEAWTLPCEQELNISFKFGGVDFPVHPLDTSLDFPGVTGPNGETYCLGAFQPISGAAEQNSFDMILGMAFLRNVYLLINFGNLANTTAGTSSGGSSAYMQLLSTTNVTEAHQQFVDTRLGGKDTAPIGLLAASVIPSSLLTTATPAITATSPAALAAPGLPTSVVVTTSAAAAVPPSTTTSVDIVTPTPTPTSTSTSTSAAATSSATAIGAASTNNESFIDQVKSFFTNKNNLKYILIGAGCIAGLLILLISLCVWASLRRKRRWVNESYTGIP